jgi:hypothetical protein
LRRRWILHLLWRRVPEERAENDAQTDKHQNAGPPMSLKKYDGKNNQPETTPRAEKSWTMSKFSISAHIVILYK